MARINISRTGISIFIVLVLLFFYVYQKIQMVRLGYKIRSVDKKTKVLKKENSFLQLNISSLESPEHIAEEVKKLGLDLHPPEEDDIKRIR